MPRTSSSAGIVAAHSEPAGAVAWRIARSSQTTPPVRCDRVTAVSGQVDGASRRRPVRRATLPPPTGPPAGWYRDPSGHAAGALLRRPALDGSHRAGRSSRAAAGRTRSLPIAVAVGAVAVLDGLADRQPRPPRARSCGFEWPIAVYAAISVVIGYGPSVWWCWYATGGGGPGSRRDDLGLRLPLERPRVGAGRLARGDRVRGRRRRAVAVLDIPLVEQHRGHRRARPRPHVRHRAAGHGRRRRADRRGDGVPGARAARPAQPDRAGRRPSPCRACCSAWPTSTRRAAPATSAWCSSSPPSAWCSAARPTCCGASARRSSPTPSSTAS